MFELTPAKLVRLRADTEIAEFDCGDDDLNEFLTVDAQQYLAQLLTVTYLVMDCDKLAAFFSLSNDKLTCAPDDTGAKKVWNRMQRRIPNIKRRRSYPAVKIGQAGLPSGRSRRI